VEEQEEEDMEEEEAEEAEEEEAEEEEVIQRLGSACSPCPPCPAAGVVSQEPHTNSTFPPCSSGTTRLKNGPSGSRRHERCSSCSSANGDLDEHVVSPAQYGPAGCHTSFI